MVTPSPTTPTETPPTPPTENLLPSSLTSSSPSPYDFRARGPHDVSRAPSPYWPALLRQPEPRVPRVGALSTAPSAPPPRLRPLPRRRLRRLGQLDGALRSNLTHLASHGFVVVSPTVAIVAPTPRPRRLADHPRVSRLGRARDGRSNAPLFGQIDPSGRGLLVIPAARAARAATDATLAAGPGPAPDPPRSPAWAPSRPAPASTSTR